MAEKVALITGGASGMGLAVAKSLAFKGWKVSIIDFSDAGEQVAAELGGIFFKVDVTAYEALGNAFAKTWEKYGRLDFVFANAGVVERDSFYAAQKSINGVPPRPDLTTLKIDLEGVVLTTYLAQHFFRQNKVSGGSLVMTASSGGIYPSPNVPLYTAAKHGVVGFMRATAELMFRKDNIRVNATCPGAVPTGLVSSGWDAFSQDLMTPLEKVVDVINMVIDDENMYGQAIEIIVDKHYFRGPPDWSDEKMKAVMRTTFTENPF